MAYSFKAFALCDLGRYTEALIEREFRIQKVAE